MVVEQLEQLVAEASGEHLVEQPGQAGTGRGADGVFGGGDAALVAGPGGERCGAWDSFGYVAAARPGASNSAGQDPGPARPGSRLWRGGLGTVRCGRSMVFSSPRYVGHQTTSSPALQQAGDHGTMPISTNAGSRHRPERHRCLDPDRAGTVLHLGVGGARQLVGEPFDRGHDRGTGRGGPWPSRGRAGRAPDRRRPPPTPSRVEARRSRGTTSASRAVAGPGSAVTTTARASVGDCPSAARRPAARPRAAGRDERPPGRGGGPRARSVRSPARSPRPRPAPTKPSRPPRKRRGGPARTTHSGRQRRSQSPCAPRHGRCPPGRRVAATRARDGDGGRGRDTPPGHPVSSVHGAGECLDPPETSQAERQPGRQAEPPRRGLAAGSRSGRHRRPSPSPAPRRQHRNQPGRRSRRGQLALHHAAGGPSGDQLAGDAVDGVGQPLAGPVRDVPRGGQQPQVTRARAGRPPSGGRPGTSEPTRKASATGSRAASRRPRARRRPAADPRRARQRGARSSRAPDGRSPRRRGVRDDADRGATRHRSRPALSP